MTNETDGYKVNWTKKEKALQKLEEEQKEKESQLAYQNVMAELGLPILS